MVRQGRMDDMERLLALYDGARAYMTRTGNPTQWPPDYPNRELLTSDTEQGRLYVLERHGRVCGVFVLQLAEEFGYADIRGKWLRDAPYGVIHRLAGDEAERGIFAECLDFCRAHAPDLRADTHADNKTMQHLLEKHGFVHCGEVTLADGGTRIAYQIEHI